MRGLWTQWRCHFCIVCMGKVEYYGDKEWLYQGRNEGEHIMEVSQMSEQHFVVEG